jgi:hypothetical protein
VKRPREEEHPTTRRVRQALRDEWETAGTIAKRLNRKGTQIGQVLRTLAANGDAERRPAGRGFEYRRAP